MADIDEQRMPFMAHLQKLRDRMVRAVLAVLAGTVICLFFSERLFLFLAQPLWSVLPEAQRKMQYTALVEPFMVYLKVGLFGGIVLSMPVLVQQAWKFIAPALYENEKKMAFPLLSGIVFFFVLGLTFAYMVSPVMFSYFASFQSDHLKIDLRMGEFFDFYIWFLLIFGIAFELPVFIIALAYVGIVKAEMLKQYRKHVIVGIFIGAAVLTPTADVVNQLLVAGPMCVLYELSILGARVVQGRRKVAQESVANVP